MKRLILEMGTGVDLYGGDYTKAACRAVRDAIGHSSLSLFRSCGLSHKDMQVKVTIAVQEPEKVDADIVAEHMQTEVQQVLERKLGMIDVELLVSDALEFSPVPLTHRFVTQVGHQRQSYQHIFHDLLLLLVGV